MEEHKINSEALDELEKLITERKEEANNRIRESKYYNALLKSLNIGPFL